MGGPMSQSDAQYLGYIAKKECCSAQRDKGGLRGSSLMSGLRFSAQIVLCAVDFAHMGHGRSSCYTSRVAPQTVPPQVSAQVPVG